MIYIEEKDKKTYFQETARLMNVTELIIEKDYWVCWTLEKLFSGDFANVLTFKGGTSLSKAYKIIERFSEDIDLTIDKSVLNLQSDKSLDEPNLSANQRRKRSKHFEKGVNIFIEEELFPWLQNEIEENLKTDTFKIYISEQDPSHILFEYPKILDYPESSYVLPVIKLELGARGDRSPQDIKPILTYVEETLKQAFPTSEPILVNTLAAKRTFWEKSTILHAIHHRPTDKPLRGRMSRHYYDLYKMMQNTDLITEALSDIALLEAVVQNKRAYFYETWDWYGTAKPNSFKLIPPDDRLKDIKEDYAAMQEMLFSDEENFEIIIGGLTALEQKINNM